MKADIIVPAQKDVGCHLCALVAEFYEQVPKTNRNYWVMTELIFYLHGSDVCDYDLSATKKQGVPT